MFTQKNVLLSRCAGLAVLMLLAAPLSVLAQGTPCPVDHGACFVELADGAYFFLSEGDDTGDLDNDGDIDHVLLYVDGFNDFLTTLPNGKRRVHVNQQEAVLTYCPFSVMDENGDIVPPNDECVFGSGHVAVNGRLDGPFGLCGGGIVLDGSGVRASDGEAFDFSAIFISNGRCDIVQFSIDATAR